MQKIIAQIAQEIQVDERQVGAAIALLDAGASVPFVARYRKEATGGLDDIQLRALAARLAYLRELRDRRGAIIKSIDEQGKLTPALLVALSAATTKQALEDLALMLKPGGRLCVITFHSIEDRAVKQTFARMKNPCVCPVDAPICTCGKIPLAALPKGYPAVPSEDELLANPRARSARLRCAQRL